jgi:hypothetical protein
LAVDGTLHEVTFVFTLVKECQGAVTFKQTFDKLTNVDVSVCEFELPILTPDHVFFPLPLKFITVEKIHDAESRFHTILEVSLILISAACCLQTIAMNLIFMPIAFKLISIGRQQDPKAMPHIILPLSFIRRPIVSMINTITSPNHSSNELAAIAVDHLFLVLSSFALIS